MSRSFWDVVTFLINSRDFLSIPNITIMLALSHGRQNTRSENSNAFSAGKTHTIVCNAIRADIAQFSRQRLSMGVADRVGGINIRNGGLHFSNIMQIRIQIGSVTSHIYFYRRFFRSR
jgi:hypothetical protein